MLNIMIRNLYLLGVILATSERVLSSEKQLRSSQVRNQESSIDTILQDHKMGQGLLGENFEKWAFERAVSIMKSAGLNPKPNIMSKVMLTGDARCNDGSPAGFYYRTHPNSRRWIIFLEGGWYCFDETSCFTRWNTNRHLMTSRGWMQYHEGSGILSDDPKENPHWWRSNHVYVPYCSSDCWAGNKTGDKTSKEVLNELRYDLNRESEAFNSTALKFNTQSLYFKGIAILESVINKLVTFGLDNGHSIILSGSSAGGIGVFLNVDRIIDHLTSLGKNVEVKGIADSAWFLDTKPLAPRNCESVHSCTTLKAMELGYNLWRAELPMSCKEINEHKPWRCFLGYEVLPLIKQPVFIFQWTFDEIQLLLSNVGKPVSKKHWNYIHQIGQRLKKSIKNIRYVFAPSCISHTSLTHKEWSLTKINGVLLSEALHRFATQQEKLNENPNTRRNHKGNEENESHDWPPFNRVMRKRKSKKLRKQRLRNKRTRARRKKQLKRITKLGNKIPSDKISGANSHAFSSRYKNTELRGKTKPFVKTKLVMQSDSPEISGVHENNSKESTRNAQYPNLGRQRKRRKNNAIARRKRKKRRKKKFQNNLEIRKDKKQLNRGSEEKRPRKRTMRSSIQADKSNYSISPKSSNKLNKKHYRMSGHDSACELHLVDECSWPHCNPTCPTLINPYTGVEMNRVELLKSFGLSMIDLANALGIDILTLNSMDNKDIFRILST